MFFGQLFSACTTNRVACSRHVFCSMLVNLVTAEVATGTLSWPRSRANLCLGMCMLMTVVVAALVVVVAVAAVVAVVAVAAVAAVVVAVVVHWCRR